MWACEIKCRKAGLVPLLNTCSEVCERDWFMKEHFYFQETGNPHILKCNRPKRCVRLAETHANERECTSTGLRDFLNTRAQVNRDRVKWLASQWDGTFRLVLFPQTPGIIILKALNGICLPLSLLFKLFQNFTFTY